MGLSSLDAALSGLRVSQRQISVISNNVANATTPGYSRKTLPQYSQAVAGETVGAVPGTIIRTVDLNLERDLWTQISSVGASEVRVSYLEQIEQFHGPPDSEQSVAAEISRLRDSFSALSDAPEDSFLLAETYEQADATARKINDLSELINTMRNDIQSDIQSTVNRINQLLEQIAELNDQVQDNLNISRSTAVSEDKRDEAIKELSGLIEVSFFQRGDGVLVIQTQDGVELADTRANRLEFNANPISASNYYPASDIGVYVVDNQFTGTPSTSPQAINITERSPGGRLGGLLELRDVDLQQANAQLDEMAHKMALRFEAQGLRLFTDATGTIPADTPPDPAALPAPGTSVAYVGFAGQIQVNQDIVNDNSLLRTGTYGATNIPTGSNELIQRVVEYTFGSVEYQEAYNADTTTQVDLLNRGADDLQTWLGLQSTNSIETSRDLSGFADAADFIVSTGGAIDTVGPPITTTFRLTFDSATTGAVSMDIDLSAVPDSGGNFVQDLIAHVSPGGAAYAALTPAEQADYATMNIQFTESANGQFQVNTSGSIVVDATNPANPMGQAGLNFLGLGENIGNPHQPDHPYFDIKVGGNDLTRITIEPGDTEVELLAKLANVPDLAVDTANFALDGLLRVRPGNSYANPDFGGSITITSGPFETNGATYGSPPAATGTRAGLDDGVNVISALFGSYVAGPPITDAAAVADVGYRSETTNGSGTYVAFRSTNVGPGLGTSTQLTGSTQLIDYAQKLVNYNAQEIINAENEQADDDALREILQTQLNSESGVNIDEELANLIVYQTAFSAAARVVSSVDEMFKELLNAF